MTTPSWLEKAVFYEIYPQSFCDSNGDGIGDIPGIISRLPYLKSLGVSALWLNPCFDSPFQDAGYDVSDYYKVAPRYGTNADLKQLFDEAGKIGIRVLLDLVPGHTSIEHPWFQQSCRHEKNTYSDWFIWTQSGWSWQVPGLKVISGYAEREGTFVTNFFYFQPALNYGFANPDPEQPWQQGVDDPGPQAVRAEIRNIMRFWLEMGASGFRVDMAASLVKLDPGHRATSAVWREMRAWLDQEFPEACLVSEWSHPTEALPAGFHVDFLLNFGSNGYASMLRKPYAFRRGDSYGFSFFDRQGHGNIRQFVDEYLPNYEKTKDIGQIAIITGNHDTSPRVSEGRDTVDLELVYLWILTMPGTPFIYYGDEIGLRTVHGLVSKEGGYRRTGARTPMQWDASPNAGFSTAAPEQLYLPIDPEADRPTVAAQETDPASLLNRVRRLISLRQAHPALQASGGFQVLYAEAGHYPFVYLRSQGDERLLVAINPSNQPVEVELPVMTDAEPRVLFGLAGALSVQDHHMMLHMPGVSGIVYQI